MPIRKFNNKEIQTRRNRYLDMIAEESKQLKKDYTHSRNCVLCGSNLNDFKYNIKNMNYVQCSNCELIYVNPWLTESKALERMDTDSKRLYCSEVYIPMHESILDDEMKHWAVELRYLKKYKNTGKALDVGCGLGLFLACLNDNGFDCIGIEKNSVLSNQVKEKLKLNVLNTSFEKTSFSEEVFDVITFYESLYYHYDPYKSLKKAYCLLKEGGIICVSVFNVDSFTLKYFPENIQSLSSLDMPFHFSRKTLITMMEMAGFKIIKTRSKGDLLRIESIIKHISGEIVSMYTLKHNKENTGSDKVKTVRSREIIKEILKPFNKCLNIFVRLIKRDFTIIVYGKKT